METSPIFLKNIKELDLIQPDLVKDLINHTPDENIQVNPSLNNGYYALYHNKALNSKIDSLKETERIINENKENWQQKKLLFIFGLEIGYLTKAILNEFPKTQIIICEKNLSFIYYSLQHQNFYDEIKSKRILFYHVKNIAGAEIYFKEILPQETGLFIHQASFHSQKDFYSQLKAIYHNMGALKAVNENTINRFEGLWFRNIIKNLGNYIKYPGVEILKGYLKNKPVILVAAGPSLEIHKDFLIKNQDLITIIAVNTALSFLLSINVIPHIIVVVDPQYKILSHFIPLFRKKMKHIPLLIAESTTYPTIVKKYPGPILFTDVSLLKNMIHPIISPKAHLDAGGSVITIAYSLAIFMQASPIIFIGLDLSFTNKTMHVKGNELEKEWFFSIQDRLHTIETAHYQYTNFKKLIPHNGFYHQTVLVDEAFYTYIKWLENRFTYYQETFKTYNCTQGGVAFHSIPNVKLDSLIKDLALKEKVEPPLSLVKEDQNYPAIKKQFCDLFQQQILRSQTIRGKIPIALNYFNEIYDLIKQNKKVSEKTLKFATQIETELLTLLSHSEDISLNIQNTLYQIERTPEVFFKKNEVGNKALQNIRKSLTLFDAIEKSCTITINEYQRFLRLNLSL